MNFDTVFLPFYWLPLIFFFLFFLIIFFFWYILLFYQPTSVKVVDEIKFKTIIPASSLVIRDHCWLTDGMSLFSSFPISFSQFIYLFCLYICCQYTMSMKFHGCCCLLLSHAEIPRGSSGIPSLYKTPKSVWVGGYQLLCLIWKTFFSLCVCLFSSVESTGFSKVRHCNDSYVKSKEIKTLSQICLYRPISKRNGKTLRKDRIAPEYWV